MPWNCLLSPPGRAAGSCILVYCNRAAHTFSMMYVAEATLRTRTMVQLPGLAERYVGSAGSLLIFIAVVINSLSCMIAYFSGSGDIFAIMSSDEFNNF